MMNIPDAPWIRETEATGHCSAENGAWWNNPPCDDGEDDDGLVRIVHMDDDEEDEFEGGDGDVFYGNETSDF